MRMKIIVIGILLLNSTLVQTMDIKFWEAVWSNYALVEAFLKPHPFLIHSASCGETPLSCGANQDDVEMVKILAKYGADLDVGGNTSANVFHRSVLRNKPETVKTLINIHKNRGEPDDSNEYGFYGKKTLKVAEFINNPTIISALMELQERKKMRDTQRTRLLNFVQKDTKYRDITYILSVQRNIS